MKKMRIYFKIFSIVFLFCFCNILYSNQDNKKPVNTKPITTQPDATSTHIALPVSNTAHSGASPVSAQQEKKNRPIVLRAASTYQSTAIASWSVIYHEFQPALHLKLEEIKVLLKNVHSYISNLENETKITQEKFEKLKLLEKTKYLGENVRTLDVQKTTHSIYLKYNQMLIGEVLRLEGIQNDLKALNNCQTILKEISMKLQSEKLIINEIGNYLEQIKSLNKPLNKSEVQLSAAIAPAKVLNSSLFSFVKNQEQKLGKSVIKNFNTKFSAWSLDWVSAIPKSFKSLFSALPYTLTIIFPTTLKQWVTVVVLFLASAILLVIIYFFIFRKYHMSLPLFYLLSMFVFTVDSWLIAIILFSPKVIPIFFQIGVISLLYCLIFLSELIAKKPGVFNKLQSINFFPILLLQFIVGTGCFLFEIPQLLTFVLWLSVLSISLISIIVQMTTKSFSLKVRISLGIGIIVIIILIVCTLIGYLIFSMFLGMFIITVTIVVNLGIAVTNYIKYIVYKRNLKNPHVIFIFIYGVGIPLFWTFLLALLMFWVISVRLGFNVAYVIETFDKSGFFLMGKRVLLIDLSILIFLFFVFKNMLYGINMFVRLQTESEDVKSITTFAHLHFVNLVGWFIFILIVLGFFNIYLRNLTYILGGLSLGIGFGFRQVVENIVGGITLWIDKSVAIGDIIEFDKEFGVVVHIGLRCTRVKTEEQSYVSWPNNLLISKKLTNWTKNCKMRFSKITVGIDYSVDLKKATKIMIESIKSCKHVMKTPRPFVIFREFGKSSRIFDIYFCHHINNELDSSVHESQVRYLLNEKLREAGIEIPYQQVDINIKKK